MPDKPDQTDAEEAAAEAAARAEFKPAKPAETQPGRSHQTDAEEAAGRRTEKAKHDPTNVNDAQSGRPPGSWKTRYPEEARKGIHHEFRFLAFLLVVIGVLLTSLACFDAKPWVNGPSLRLYSLATFGGMLGGWMFTTRWLINAVVSWRWDEDRRLWRYLNPFIAAALALVFYALVRSGLFQVLSPTSVGSPSASIALGFLVGYFSDRAIGKLGDIADTLFGTKHGMIDRPTPKDDSADAGKDAAQATDP